LKARARRAPGLGLEASDLAAAITGGPGRFLGRFDLSDIRRELTEAGVLSALAARGYESPRIRVDLEDGEHRLVSAVEQGRFEALVRDLGHLPVADASASADEGRVLEAATRQPVRWAPGHMLAPLSLPSASTSSRRSTPVPPPPPVARIGSASQGTSRHTSTA
jgi:hypothetical protein